MSLIHTMIVDRIATSAGSLRFTTCSSGLSILVRCCGPVKDIAGVLDHRLGHVGTSPHDRRR